jgi:SSS family solute:Na+ symporter
VLLFLSNVVFHSTNIHFLYVAPILLAISSAVLVSVSLATATGGAVSKLVWTPAFFRLESQELGREPLWRNYRAQAVALLTLTGVIVYIFR